MKLILTQGNINLEIGSLNVGDEILLPQGIFEGTILVNVGDEEQPQKIDFRKEIRLKLLAY